MIASEDVRRVTFDRAMRGYRCEDVDDYLKQVADSMDAMAAANDDLQNKLVILAQRIDQYRADEDTLSTTMINAQRLGENVIREAKQKAAEIIRAANMKAEDREQRARDEVELAQQEVVTLKKEADAFKKKLMELYRDHIELIAKLPEYPEKQEKADKAEPVQPEPAPAEPVQPAPEPVQPEPAVQPAPVEEAPAAEPAPAEDDGYFEEPDLPEDAEPETVEEEEVPEDNPGTEKADTVEFAFAPKPTPKVMRNDPEPAADSRFQPGAGLYGDAPAQPEKKPASRRSSSSRSGTKSTRKKSAPKPTTDFDSFNDLDYDV